MSYILDALRKSEAERLREQSPDFLREPIVTPPPVSRRWSWLAVVLVTPVLAIAALFLWQGIQRPEEGPQPVPPVATQPPGGVETPASMGAPSPIVSAAGESREPFPAATARAPVSSPATEVRDMGGGKVTPAEEPRRDDISGAASAEPQGVSKDPGTLARSAKAGEKNPRKAPASEIPLPPKRVLHFNELPSVVREGLPQLAVEGYVFSEDPRSRMVVINNRMLQEGDELGSDLKLERIGPEGAVLNYKGYRFFAPR